MSLEDAFPAAASVPPGPAQVTEQARLAALYAHEILDTPPEESFDRITALAMRMFRVPIALISFVDAERQWFKAKVGLTQTETPRDVSFCSHAIRRDGVLLVSDATRDARFADNPLVVGEPHIRFYAGAPLLLRSGHRLGTLCLIDNRLRPEFSPADCDDLARLADIVVSELELRLVNRDLSVARQAAESATATKSRWLAMTSHDLRQPVQAILGYTELLSEQLTDPAQQKLAARIDRAAARIGTALDKLMELARVDAGAVVPKPVIVPLGRALHEVRDAHEHRAREKGVRLEMDPCEAQIVSDPEMLAAILHNLVGNAIKYTSSDGCVRITCRAANSALVVHIEDTGIGIPSDKIDAIWEAFYRIDGRVDEPGLGLGLSIVRRAADLLGHALDVTSTLGAGSCFKLTLPLAGSGAG